MSNKYSNGKIYCLRNRITEHIYIGSTTQPLCYRFSDHKARLKCGKYNHMALYKIMSELGIESFYIELMELCPCSSKEELRKKEGEHIRKHMNECRELCLNSVISGRSRKEWVEENYEHVKLKRKKHYQDNKERISERTKLYVKMNRGTICAKLKRYYEENKLKIREKQKEAYEKRRQEKIHCDVCHMTMIKDNYKRHLISSKHIENSKSFL